MFLSTPDPIIAVLSDLGRMSLARVANGEISFTLTGFAVGRGGYNGVDPVKVDPIDPSLTALEDQFFPISGIKALESIEFPTPKTTVANCRLESDDAVAGLGEIGLWATISHSSVLPAEIGTEFLFAVSHYPIVTKTLRQAIVFRIITQF